MVGVVDRADRVRQGVDRAKPFLERRRAHRRRAHHVGAGDQVLPVLHRRRQRFLDEAHAFKRDAVGERVIARRAIGFEAVGERIKAGADGYFLKTSPTAKIIEGIKEVMEGGAPMTATVAKKVLTKFKDQPKNVTEVFELNEQERTILNHLVNGLSYKMIADVTNISYSSVNMYIKRIYKKLQVHSATEAISKATKNKII